MKIGTAVRGLFFMLALAALALPVGTVSAHGSTQVGNYTLEIGFMNEPAYHDYPNGLDLIVTDTSTGKPVTGLQNSLKAAISFGPSQKTLAITPVAGADGEYTAAVIPTEVGDYTWRIFGTINNTPVDVSMTSSPSTFASVISESTDAFPGRTNTSPQALLRELQRARTTSIIALVVGVVAALLSIISLGVAFSQGRKT